MTRNRKQPQKRIAPSMVIGCLMLLAGLVLILYPLYASLLARLQADGRISVYQNQLNSIGDTDKLLADAREYNADLASGQIRLYDPFSQEGKDHLEQYNELLHVSDDGMMAVISIPSVSIRLPVFHGTDAETLEKGAGHLSGTSLPVGGSSTHAVITGHTGLSGARLFTDLIQCKEGDLIRLEVLGYNLWYKVTGLSVVEPSDLSELYIEPGRDLLTLVTCTPYGINTHRLLVHAQRTETGEIETEDVENTGPIITASSEWLHQYGISLTVGALIVLIIYILSSLCRRRSANEADK